MNTDTKTKVVTGKKLLRLAKQGRLVTTKLAHECYDLTFLIDDDLLTNKFTVGYKKKPWQKKLKKEPRLCWVGEDIKDHRILRVVTEYNPSELRPYVSYIRGGTAGDKRVWTHAEPVEVKNNKIVLRGEK